MIFLLMYNINITFQNIYVFTSKVQCLIQLILCYKSVKIFNIKDKKFHNMQIFQGIKPCNSTYPVFALVDFSCFILCWVDEAYMHAIQIFSLWSYMVIRQFDSTLMSILSMMLLNEFLTIYFPFLLILFLMFPLVFLQVEVIAFLRILFYSAVLSLYIFGRWYSAGVKVFLDCLD